MVKKEILKPKTNEFESYYKLRKEANKYFVRISGNKIPLSKKEVKAEFSAPKKNKKNKIYFLKINGGIAGYMNFTAMRRSGKKLNYLGDIVIAEKFKGKGYGKYFMKKFIKMSKEKGIDRIGLGTMAENKTAIKLYKKLGFEIKGYNFGMDLK